MMHRKGLLFAPSSPYTAQILAATNPPEIKRLGRKIPNFVQSVWDVQRERIVEEGNYLKFSQNPELRRGLLETGVRELVEAARSDRVWGVGFNERDAEGRRGEWGLNLLGKCLERVRNRIREEGEVIE